MIDKAPQPDWVSPCGDFQLYCGDCMDILPHLGRTDAVVTDPPYGVGLKAKTTKHLETSASSVYRDDFDFVRSMVIPRIEKSLSICRTAAITPGNKMLQSYPQASDVGTVFFPNGAGRSPFGFNCNNPVLFYGRCPFTASGLGGRPNSVAATQWRSREVDHPCPKPIEFMEWMVGRVSFEGELILDPFMGSGTTGIACVRLKRRFIGIELDRHYFDIAVNSIKDALGMEVPNKHGQIQKRMFVEAAK